MNSCGKPNFPERENQSKNEGSEFANFPIGKFSPFTSRRGMQFPEQENNRQIVLEIIGFRIAQIDAALPCLRSRQTISFRVPTDHRPLGGSRSCWLQFASVRKTRKSCILNPLKGGAVAMKCSSTGDIQRAAISEPVIITNHGCPRLVILTVEVFARLKAASGEPVPVELRRECKASVRRGLPEDPLGYDTSDTMACARAMAEAAPSGKNALLWTLKSLPLRSV